jgi:hypothetical protein
MASERSRIKNSVIVDSTESGEPPLLQNAISTGQSLQHELAKEANRSKEALRTMELAAKASDQKAELGKIGQYLGGKEMAPLGIALIALLAGLGAMFICYHYAAYSPNSQSWLREADGALAFSYGALSFIFGRASRR